MVVQTTIIVPIICGIIILKNILISFSRPLLFLLITILAMSTTGREAKDIPNLPPERGIVVVTGKGEREMARHVLKLAHSSAYTIYFQSPDAATVLAVRKAADSAGLLGQSVFVEQSGLDRICLGDNMADIAFVSGAAVKEKEVLRVLRPGAVATVDGRQITKPASKETDAWSHPFHGPDNNP